MSELGLSRLGMYGLQYIHSLTSFKITFIRGKRKLSNNNTLR